MKKMLLFLLCSLMLAYLGCRNDQAGTIAHLIGSSEIYGGKITLTYHQTLPKLNPLKNRTPEARSLYYFIYDNLIDIDQQLQFVPRLAKSWKIAPDSTSITFHLRDDVHWHDDHLFSADDVIYCFEEYKKLPDPERPGKMMFDYVEQIEAINPYTIAIRYNHPHVLALADWTIEIVPKPLDRIKNSKNYNNPIGSGPYSINLSSTNETTLSLEAFDGYWNGRSHIDQINILFDSSYTKIKQLFKAGKVDHLMLNDEDITAKWKDEFPERINIFDYPSLNYYYIGWRCKNHTFFSHRRVRKAMSLTLDRERILNELFQGSGSLCDVPLPPWTFEKNVRSIPYSPILAVDLLREVGCKDNDSNGVRELDGQEFRFTLIYRVVDTFAHSITELYQDRLRKIGVIMTPLALPDVEFFRRLEQGDFDAFLTDDAVSIRLTNLEMFMEQDEGEKNDNVIGFYDPQLNHLLNTLFFNSSTNDFSALFHQIIDRILQEQPCTFIVYKPDIVLMNIRIKMVQPSRRGLWEWYPSILDWHIPEYLQVKQDSYTMNDQ